MDWKNQLESWDRDIKAGLGRDVAASLRKLNYSKIPRRFVAPVAKIAYRANVPFVSIRVIAQLIRPGKNRWGGATELEIAEYAMALIRVGASREALRTLEPLDSRRHPIVSLYRSFALITRWEYAGSIPLLTDYISNSPAGEYQNLIARVNLASAQVITGQYTEAEKHLNLLLRETGEKNLSLLHGNCLELMAQLAIGRRDWGQAEKLLREGHDRLAGSRSVDFLFLQKWQAVVKLERDHRSSGGFSQLERVREHAVRLQHWETVRECDFYKAKFSDDRNLLHFVYFGTPFPAYREIMMKRLDHKLAPPEAFVYGGNSECKPSRVFDLKSARMDDRSASLKEGGLVHRFLNHMCSDFYRPLRFGSIFDELYPDEYYDPELSLAKINQLAQRLRGWFAESGIDGELKGKTGTLQLLLKGQAGFRRHSEGAIVTGLEVYRERLKQKFAAADFSAAEAAEVLGVSKRMVNKIIACDEAQTIVKIGSGPRVKYRFAA